ncbi:MAG: histidine kinase, partial [Lachnospiraceae bacterium]|nr:histidine kinase [Lachnospiraceae bacterium]
FLKNWMALTFMSGCFAIILAVSIVACYFAYEQRRGELLADFDMALSRTADAWQDLTGDFWSVYLPIFQQEDLQEVLSSYFNEDTDLVGTEKLKLAEQMEEVAKRSEAICWVALISDNREVNYIYYPSQTTIQWLEEDFPYWEELAQKVSTMEIYGMQTVNAASLGESYDCIAIAGGLPSGWSDGTILVGFSVESLMESSVTNSELLTLQFDIAISGRSVFTSGGEAFLPEDLPEKGEFTVCGEGSDARYTQVSGETVNGARIYYSLEWTELFWASHRATPMIMGFVVLAFAVTFLLYMVTLRMLGKEVEVIRSGLSKMGQNQLDTRIEGDFTQSGFEEIADSINIMAESLKENIDRAHEYELRQKEAELQELQAKFNPHFLYNSLEMFSARCYQNGDSETAEIINQTAAIFRGFIGSRSFIPMGEELAFSQRYLALFKARYGDKVKIRYDIDTEVLEYGIVRNSFQPLIENYFVHGIDPGRDDNYISFRGHLAGENDIEILVEDNGKGMTKEECERMNESLREQIRSEKESYGVKNLHQRLVLFYGEGYGLSFYPNQGGGLCVRMLIGRKNCELS